MSPVITFACRDMGAGDDEPVANQAAVTDGPLPRIQDADDGMGDVVEHGAAPPSNHGRAPASGWSSSASRSQSIHNRLQAPAKATTESRIVGAGHRRGYDVRGCKRHRRHKTASAVPCYGAPPPMTVRARELRPA
jgi:hypothetical protein